MFVLIRLCYIRLKVLTVVYINFIFTHIRLFFKELYMTYS